MNRKQLQATIKQLKVEGKVSKKFDARQSNLKLATEIEKVTGQKIKIQQNLSLKKNFTKVVSYDEAVIFAESKGYALQYSASGMKLELYTGTSGRPEKFMLPSEVISYIKKLAA